MSNMNNVIALFAAAALLSACGGGGGDNNSAAAPAPSASAPAPAASAPAPAASSPAPAPAPYTMEEVRIKADTALNGGLFSLNVIENALNDSFLDLTGISTAVRDLVTNKKDNISDIIIAKVVSAGLLNAAVDDLTVKIAAISANHSARLNAISDTKLKAAGIIDFPKWKKDALVKLYELGLLNEVLTTAGISVPQIKLVLDAYYASPALTSSDAVAAKSLLDMANLK